VLNCIRFATNKNKNKLERTLQMLSTIRSYDYHYYHDYHLLLI